MTEYVTVGSHVRIQYLDTNQQEEYTIVDVHRTYSPAHCVGPYGSAKLKSKIDSSPECENGEISKGSPLGKALLGATIGTVKEVKVPDGLKRIKVLSVVNHRRASKKHKNGYGNSIEGIIKKRKLQRLYHFTRIENLENILKHGLLSINMLKRNNIQYICNDSQRFERKPNHLSFSVEQINRFLLNKFKGDYENSIWCIIEVDIEFLLNHKGRLYFCCHNAASKSIRKQLNDESLCSANAFEAMFSQECYYELESGPVTIIRNETRPNIPTSIQAEILIEDCVPKNYIQKVYFVNDEDKNSFYRILKKSEAIRGCKLLVDNTIF